MAEDSTIPKISFNKRVTAQGFTQNSATGSASHHGYPSQAAAGNAYYGNFTAAGQGSAYSRYGVSGPSGAVNVSPSLDHFSQPPQFPRQTSYSRYLPISNTINSSVTYGQGRWGQQEPASPTKHVQFAINTSNAHLYYKFITDRQTGIPHQERIVNGELQRVLVGTDILDWIMVNLDGASSVEQAQLIGLQLMSCELLEDLTDKENKQFSSGPNSFYCVNDKHKEKPKPPSEELPETSKEQENNAKHSFSCTIL
ncbi:uncharacterized protein [Dysidea avara]|uniref:uncharacterized protein n=1 Tax=Dysidea avara TaxID=196820 RepID=UPI003316F029